MCWVSHVLATRLLTLSSSLWLSQLSPTMFPWEAHPSAGSGIQKTPAQGKAAARGSESHIALCCHESSWAIFWWPTTAASLSFTQQTPPVFCVHVPPYLTSGAQEIHRIWHLASQIFVLWEDEACMLLPGWQNLKIKSHLRGYIGLL